MSGAGRERELVDILSDDEFYPRRVAGSGNPDVIAARNGKVYYIEVKSSREKKRYLTDSGNHDELNQFFSYILSSKKYNIPFYYFFRYITRERVPKWKVTKLPKSREDIPFDMTNSGNIILKYEDGITYKEWEKDA